MKILDRRKLEGFLQDYPGETLSDRLKDFCLRNATADEEASPRFDRLILARSGLIVYLYGESRALTDRLGGLEWEKES
ncbi:MAG: hypothetical protein HYY20_14465 [Candidatus Tectomicrobia bacterium]|uniref:Uncharacterized protein n=1 Tax=Tectimicrobiota bacterium TaxID=2528274 RepID=A0A932CT11_UNCTE|nr:hypothetical protein [Candidatus Tectomicrobia bacterium]